MRKLYLSFAFIMLTCLYPSLTNAQIEAPKFGKGLQINALDSSFYMKIGLRFQTLFVSDWNILDDDFANLEDDGSAFLIRRARLKFDGWAVSPKIKYKCELALSNRDNGGGNSPNFNNAANIILDANVTWNFYKGFSLWAGQGKMPGNRERLISSGNMQFVDRSRLNSRYTLDRDAGVMLTHKHKLGSQLILKQIFAISSGEGKNITSGNVGGRAYTFKVEAYPFGNFQSKGEYVGSAVKREVKPKLAVAAAYDINHNAGRERGQKGNFILDENGYPGGKTLRSFFADLMFKYKGWSVMMEFVNRDTEDGDPNVLSDENSLIGTYYTGSATNLSVGYMMKSNWEIAARWTKVDPHKDVANEEDQYTIGVSKFIVGHKLKVQTDLTYRAIDQKDNNLFYRLQMDIHF